MVMIAPSCGITEPNMFIARAWTPVFAKAYPIIDGVGPEKTAEAPHRIKSPSLFKKCVAK